MIDYDVIWSILHINWIRAQGHQDAMTFLTVVLSHSVQHLFGTLNYYTNLSIYILLNQNAVKTKLERLLSI